MEKKNEVSNKHIISKNVLKSKPLIFRKMQIQFTMRCYHTHDSMAIIKKFDTAFRLEPPYAKMINRRRKGRGTAIHPPGFLENLELFF